MKPFIIIMQDNPLGPNNNVIILKNLRIINSNPSLGYLTIQKQLLHLFSSVIILLPRFITFILLYSIHYILYIVYTKKKRKMFFK